MHKSSESTYLQTSLYTFLFLWFVCNQQLINIILKMNLWRKPKLFKNLDYLVPEFFFCFVFFLVFNPQSHSVETSSKGKGFLSWHWEWFPAKRVHWQKTHTLQYDLHVTIIKSRPVYLIILQIFLTFWPDYCTRNWQELNTSETSYRMKLSFGSNCVQPLVRKTKYY